jgi:hypothetical protein
MEREGELVDVAGIVVMVGMCRCDALGESEGSISPSIGEGDGGGGE